MSDPHDDSHEDSHEDSHVVARADPVEEKEHEEKVPTSERLDTSKVSFEDAFNATGHGKFNYVVLLTCGLVLLYTYSESLGVGYMIPAAQCDLHLDVHEKGLVNAATFIGIVATAIIWGYLSDNYGRRRVMLPALAANVVASLASSLSQGFLDLFLLRMLTGCLVSASSATVFAYLGEFTGDAHRASFMAWGALFISLSFIELPTLAWVIIGQKWSFSIGGVQVRAWRIFMWSWGLSGLTAVSIMILLPESPRFLMANYGPTYALPILKKMYAVNHNKHPDDYPIKDIETSSTATVYHHGLKVAWMNLTHMFQPPLLRCMIISHINMFMAFVMASGLFTWMPEILDETLDNVHSYVSICDILENKYAAEKCPVSKEEKHLNDLLYPVTICMGIISTGGYAMVAIFVNKFGKIKIYWTLIFGGCVLLCASGLIPFPPLSIALYIIGLMLGISASVLAAIAVEVFPTSVRALALCTLYMMGRLGAAVGATIVGYTIHEYCEILFVVLSITVAGTAFLFWIWPSPEHVRREMEAKGFFY